MTKTLILSLAIAAVGWLVPARAGPVLVLEQSEFDFGRQETNSTGRHAFTLANCGDQPLVLKQRTASCGCCTCLCSITLPERGEIPPGATASLTLQWEIKQYTGAFQHSETLTTNDVDRPEVTLRVTGRITPTVRVVPTQLVFSRVPQGQPATGEIRLFGYQAGALEILGCEFSDPATAGDFKLHYEPLPAAEVAAEPDARSGCRLRVEVQPGLAAGPFRQQLMLRTNVASAAAIEIPVAGTVGSEITISGFGWDERTGVWTLGTVAVARGTERRLQVVLRGSQTAEGRLKLVRVSPDVLRAELGLGKRLGESGVTLVPLTVRIPPGSRPANHLGSKADELGQIVIATGHPKQPELLVLVRFAVRPEPASGGQSPTDTAKTDSGPPGS